MKLHLGQDQEDWQMWFESWLAQYPMKEPPLHLRQDFTAEVMARIKPAKAPFHTLRWIPIPRFSFALGTVAASVLLLLVLFNNSATQMASRVEKDLHILSEVGEITELPNADLAEEGPLADQLMFSEVLEREEEISQITESVDLLQLLEPERGLDDLS